jgi:two-component system, OmpR family, phosphate regulon sensor histidine kinase PhoR
MACAARLDAPPALRLYASRMRASHVPLRRLCVAAAVLALPAALVLFALVMRGDTPWWQALLGLLFVAVVLAFMVRRHLAGLAAVGRQIEDLAEDRAPTAMAPPLGTAAELSSALAALSRKWAGRNADLRAAIAVNEAMVDAIPDPILLLDHQRHIVRTNAAARDLFGARIVDRAIDTVLRDPNVLEAVDEVLAGRVSSAARLSLPGTVERHFDVRVAHLSPGANDGVAVLLALYDVTAIRRAEQMRADFVANVSHELRTPLSTLLGFTETLRGAAREDSAARERFLGIMHEQASRMSRLVRDLLSLSRIEETEHTPPTGEVRIGTILSAVVDGLILQARGKNIDVLVDIQSDLPAVIGDADQLTQVFQNLVDNAIKYGRANSKVRVTAQRAQRTAADGEATALVAIGVADEGDGIPREHLPRLTERFYRVDAGRSRQLGGTGLGLAIVKHIVNRHRGALTIDSEVGRGTVFTVYLVAAAPQAAPAAPPQPARAVGVRPGG